jgi:hypothetical protein
MASDQLRASSATPPVVTERTRLDARNAAVVAAAEVAGFRRGLGLSDQATEGEGVRLTPDGLAPIEGVVDYVSPNFLGVRSDDAVYRFIYGFEGSVMVGHHLFSEGVDQAEAEEAWRSWLTRLFAAGGGRSFQPGASSGPGPRRQAWTWHPIDRP